MLGIQEVQEVQEFTESGRPKRKSTRNVNYDLSEIYDDEAPFDFDLLVQEVEADEQRF